MKVHPAADVFPMMTDGELDQLAQDIKEHGQLHPIIMDGDVLIDGRNRVAACKRAGIEVEAEELGDRDAMTVILSANVSRRHLTVGQRAMGVVLVKASGVDINTRRRGERRAVLAATGVSASSLMYAEYVYKYARDLVDQVMAGAYLNEAYKAAQERKKRKETQEEQHQRALKRLDDDRARLLVRIEEDRKALGPTVKVPPEPELTIQFAPGPNGEKIQAPPVPNNLVSLGAMSKLYKRLRSVQKEVEALANEPVIEDAYSLELHVMTIRDWVSSIVAPLYTMTEKHNDALKEGSKLRRVQ